MKNAKYGAVLLLFSIVFFTACGDDYDRNGNYNNDNYNNSSRSPSDVSPAYPDTVPASTPSQRNDTTSVVDTVPIRRVP